MHGIRLYSRGQKSSPSSSRKGYPPSIQASLTPGQEALLEEDFNLDIRNTHLARTEVGEIQQGKSLTNKTLSLSFFHKKQGKKILIRTWPLGSHLHLLQAQCLPPRAPHHKIGQ